MREFASWGLETAKIRGASLAEARIVDEQHRALATKNGQLGAASDSESLGIGIRVIADGAFGFAATDVLTREGIQSCAARAVEIAKASAQVKAEELRLVPEPAANADWSSSCKVDPFSIPIDKNLELLFAIDQEMRKVKGVTLAEASLNFRRYEQWFFSTAGSEIHQVITTTGAGYSAYSYQDGEIQKRSYPNSFGGQYQNKGYELIEELSLLEHAGEVAEQAVALHSAKQCPEGTSDIILDSDQLSLQIHESIGHPIELDRVLGMEANFAGTSFLTLDKLGRLKYGSDIVNVVADATQAHGPGLGTFAYDDEGVAAQCTPVITNGLFTGYLTSRDTAAAIGAARSGGCLRAEGWNRLPIVRMTNVSILPGELTLSLNELIASTERGVLMQTNRSWSIDDKRYNFQFGCEVGWEIVGGKRGRMLKNPSYSGITTEFWNKMDAICSQEEWTLWGTPNCGKGQPQQVMGTGHGAAPARFRGITVGTAYKGNN